MKRITLLLVALACSTALFAQQPFEGKVSFKLSLDIDSMEGVDSAMMGAEAKEMVAKMMPEQFVYLVSKDVIYFKMEEGGLAEMMQMEVLFKADGHLYFINHANKNYFILDTAVLTKYSEKYEDLTEGIVGGVPMPQIKIEPLGETETVLGIECKKYKVDIVVKGEALTEMLWITDKYKFDFVPENRTFGVMPGGASLFLKEINGMPLKATVNFKGFIMTMEASSLSAKKLPKKTFKLPKGYKEVDSPVKGFSGF